MTTENTNQPAPRARSQSAHEVMTADEFRRRFGAPEPQGAAPPSVARVIGGANAQAAGQAFEGRLALLHAEYQAHEYAMIHHLPVPTAPAPKKAMNPMYKGPPLCIRTRRQLADYFGAVGVRVKGLCPALRPHVIGRAIYMEAKSSGEKLKRLPIVREDQISGFGLKAHQLRGLETAMGACRALAAVVWNNGREIGVLTPLHVKRYARTPGAKAIPWTDFRPVPAVGGWLLPVLEEAAIEEVGR